jgi:ribosomal protein L14
MVQADGVTGDGVFVRDPQIARTVHPLVARSRAAVVVAERDAVGRCDGVRIAVRSDACIIVIPASAGRPLDTGGRSHGLTVLRAS